MTGFDFDAWAPQEPPSGFSEGVMARVRAEKPKPRRWRWAAAATGGLALAAAIALQIKSPPVRGDVTAEQRIEVSIGRRAIAVVESGGVVTWDGEYVEQSSGDVFYRVEPGARFTVHTPAGDVEVKGTCFTVKVRNMHAKSAAAGAAITALAFVAVYEGKVAVSHAAERLELRAGESASTGPDGVKRTDEKGFDTSVSAVESDPTGTANQNLVRQVSEYRSRLEAISSQKAELEQKLKKTEETLVAAQDGAPIQIKNPFDLSQEEWKELAKSGDIKYRTPCVKKHGGAWSPNAKDLDQLGLAPQDGDVLKAAYAHSNERLWSLVKPLCAKAVGSAEVAERIGTDTCTHLVLDSEDYDAAMAARREVGEIRAGLRPMPGPNERLHPVTKLFLGLTAENKLFEDELAQTLGPEEAHRLAFATEGLCINTSHFGGDKPKK